MKVFYRMSFYWMLTTLISFVSQIEGVEFNDITSEGWVKLGIKSLLPGLISLKAFMDETISHERQKQADSENITNNTETTNNPDI